jgi:hypothetical protein
MLPRDFLPVASLIDQPMFICSSAASEAASQSNFFCRDRHRETIRGDPQDAVGLGSWPAMVM